MSCPSILCLFFDRVALRRIQSGWPSVLGWLLIAFVFIGRAEAAGKPLESLRSYVERNQRRQAYGVYIAGRKFGWAIDELKLGQREGKDVAIYTFEMHGDFAAAGERSHFEEKTITYYDLAGKGEIAYAEEESSEDGNQVSRTVTRWGDEILITTRSKVGESLRRAPIPKERVQLMRDLELWLTSSPKRGARFESYSTAFDQTEIDTRELFSYRGKKSILWGGVKTDVYLVSVDVDGMTMNCEALADGTPVRGMIGGLFELRAEKEAIARQFTTAPIDMLQASSIKVNKALGDPARVDSLHVQISGLGNFSVPTSHRQRIQSRGAQTLTVHLTRDRRAEKPSPLAAVNREEYLKATPSLQCDHETIRGLAKEIAGEERDHLRAADRLQAWVFAHVRQTMAANTANALEVLHNRAGDCTEITMLFVALARAAGIPAREVGGIMYANDGAPIFGWHAWAEIHDGHQWVSIDPTWNQVYVDATHIKLAEGANDWAWVNLLGKMKVKVLKFTTNR